MKNNINTRPFKVCSCCVMDTTDSKIVFDESGVCDFCNDYKKNILNDWKPNTNNMDKLMKISQLIKKNNKCGKYDCIIGMSGGVDSSYLCYLAKEIMGLKPLIYVCNTGWNTEVADENIKKIVTALNLDVYEEVIDWDEMKDLQLAFLKSQVPYQDFPQDHAIFSGLYNYAVKHKIKYVLTGANIATESIRPPLEWVYMNDKRMMKDIHKKFGSRKLNTFPSCGILKYKIWYKYFKGMKRIAPLDYIAYDKKNIEKFLNERFDWKSYKNKHYENVFTRWYEGYYLIEKFGYDKRKCYFSNLIHIGEVTRDEALKEISLPPYALDDIRNDSKIIAEKLGLTVNELNDIIKGENKTFEDYKNQYGLMKFGIWLSRLLKIENRNFR